MDWISQLRDSLVNYHDIHAELFSGCRGTSVRFLAMEHHRYAGYEVVGRDSGEIMEGRLLRECVRRASLSNLYLR